ncbi:RNA polymerase sigma factor [Marinicaulis aureus]|uniref:RNA polymerase sigma factor n=1 Tax=Hyphococcus aureus TaxID=2666033 RepID=A0ABW1L3H0_9PROT|nr:RNA polymerase subunit sigma-24 [Parvularcula sp.]
MTSNEVDKTVASSDGKAAVEAVLTEVHRDMFRFLVRRLGDEHEAADVLQEFYVKILTRFSDLRDADKLRGWMASVLRSVIADHYRARGRRARLAEAYRADAALFPAFDDEEIDLVICACLYKLLPTLKDEYAAILWRTDLVGEARETIAADLGLNENAFRVKLHRARQALRKRLEQTCETCPMHGFFKCGCSTSQALRNRVAAAREASGGDNA